VLPDFQRSQAASVLGTEHLDSVSWCFTSTLDRSFSIESSAKPVTLHFMICVEV
jgi:hypothetical protein